MINRNELRAAARREPKTRSFLSAVSFILLFSILCGPALFAAGCASSGNTEDTSGTDSAPSTETIPHTEAPETEMKIVENGVANFRVIRADLAENDDDDVMVAVAIKKAISSYATVTPCRITTDWGNGDDTETYEVLVGNVDYPCTQTALASLSYGEYIVRLDGRKIMILSLSNSGIEEAGAAFMLLMDEFKTENSDGTVTVSIPVERLNISEKETDLFSVIPTLDGLTLTSQLIESKNAMSLFFNKGTYDIYSAYSSEIAENGYRLFMTGTYTDEYRAFSKGNIRVTVRFYRLLRRIEIKIERVNDLSKLETSLGLVVKDEAPVRTEPKDDAPVSAIGTLKKYDVVELEMSGSTGWYKIKSGDSTGYCDQQDMRSFTSVSALKAYAAVVWARDIAADNDFHYGYNAWSHHYGCFFCGTNAADGVKCRNGASYEDQLKTYCCNPFVTAAYCHGAGAVKYGKNVASIVNCIGKNINLANDNNPVLTNTRNFVLIDKPENVSDLRPGDILLTPKHAMIYTENGMIAEASGGDDNVRNSEKWNNSIRERAIGNTYASVTKIYRYILE